MKIKFTDNVTESLLDVLKPQLSEAKEIKFGVAFAKYSGFLLIENNLKECLENGGKVDFLLGLDFRTTEPKLLRALCNLKNQGLNVSLFCFSDPSVYDIPVYHPKIYLIRGMESVLISIGSSNLTAGGLKNNVEVNAIIEANIKEEIVSDIYEIYNKFKFQRNRFEPDLAYIENYEEVYKIIRNKNTKILEEKSIKSKIKRLKEREKTLPKPKPVKTELFGWQKLVYERLPKGVFRTSDMYTYENEFQKFYPQNRHIKDKIRQILQQLRDLKLLKHIATDKWEKIDR